MRREKVVLYVVFRGDPTLNDTTSLSRDPSDSTSLCATDKFGTVVLEFWFSWQRDCKQTHPKNTKIFLSFGVSCA